MPDRRKKHKLKVMTAPSRTAIALVRSEVSLAIGPDPVAELQEIERSDLVVELALPADDRLPGSPAELAREVARASHNLEVLSAWVEQDPAVPSPPCGPADVLDWLQASTHPVALQSLLDDVPTAMWQPAEHSWSLCVPVAPRSMRHAVAVDRHLGYSQRFTASDVASLRRGYPAA